ncbi:hypothetical protein GCM10010208_46720 [Actinomadura livida]|nr:hypothetical protein GCM10010208_46720 [Actinomadura livida]
MHRADEPVVMGHARPVAALGQLVGQVLLEERPDLRAQRLASFSYAEVHCSPICAAPYRRSAALR